MDHKDQVQYQNLVLTPINRIIPRLALPTVISMLVSMIYNLVDAYFVGKLGTSASAAIGILLSISASFQAIGFMCGHGSGSRISVLLGKGKKDVANQYASVGFYLSLALSIILMLVAFLFLTPLMRMLGSTETILPYAKDYGIYILLSGPALAASCVLNNIMRYEGKAIFAMIGLVLGGLLNMIGDPFFMFVLHMDIKGAGLSTALSQYISFFVLLYMFVSHRTITKIDFKNVYNHLSHIPFIFQNGLPSLIRQLLNALSSMVLNISSSMYGDGAIAAMTIVGRVMMFFGSGMIGIGQGFQPVCAYDYGARKFKRIRDGFFFTWIFGEVILGILGVIGFIYASELVRLFRNDQVVIEIGTVALRYQCFSLILQPLSIIANMTFQAIGQSKIASVLASLRSGVYFIPVVLILPHFIGIVGIEIAQLIADILTIITCIPIIQKFFKELPKVNERVELDQIYEESRVKA